MKLGTLLSMAAMAVMGMGLALPAQAADPIKIGVYLPLTGQNAFGGQLELEGIQLAHKLKPTVLDRPVELVVVDNKSDKVEAANAVKRLTEHEKVLAIIGTYGSSLAMAGGEVAERAKVPVLATSSTNPLVTQGKKYYFRACFIDPYQGAAAATYAYKNLGYKKAAVLTDVVSDYAVGLSNFFKKSYKKLGGELVADMKYSSGDQDFTAQLTELISKKPDIVFMPAYFAEGAIIMKQARELGMSVFEDPASPNALDMEHLRRQRMTALILSQVYVAWAQYMSAVEDYQINMEIASTSENIAEDFTIADGSKAEKSQLEASRAIEDEVKAFKSYADLQESLGNLYATIGLDAIPYYMLNEKPSKIAVYLRNTLEKWGKGDFMPDNRPYLLNIPAKRPPVNLSSDTLLPDVKGETGKKITVKVPDSALARMDFEGQVISRAGTIDDKPLPKWLTYNEETRTFNGTAMPGQEGTYNLKVYFSDEKGNVAYMTFKITIKEVYVPSLTVKGQVPGSTATVLKRCVGSNCKDDYIIEDAVGNDIRTSAQ